MRQKGKLFRRVALLIVALVAFAGAQRASATTATVVGDCQELGSWAYGACRNLGGSMFDCAVIATSIYGWCLIFEELS